MGGYGVCGVFSTYMRRLLLNIKPWGGHSLTCFFSFGAKRLPNLDRLDIYS
jgi:hypothetical protein